MNRALTIFFLSIAVVCQSATISVNCDYNSITNALLSTAQEGDTVQIAAGDCYITNAINVDREISFSIAGAGSNSTTLRAMTQGKVFWIQSNSSNLFAIHDLNILDSLQSDPGAIVLGHPAKESPGPYRVYNVQFTNVVKKGICMGFGKSKNSYGLIDHCYFHSTDANYSQMLEMQGSGTAAWTNANPIGTTNAFYVENCYFYTTHGGNGYFDSYQGAQVVFRFNFCDGFSPIGGHGYDSQSESIRTWEVYNNTFTNATGSAGSVWRGGSGVIFSNTFYGTIPTIAGVAYYRSCPSTFSGQSTITGYLLQGVPGSAYVINMNGTSYPIGTAETFPANLTNTQILKLGYAQYVLRSNLSDAAFGDVGSYGGGTVLLGATPFQTASNLYAAVNKVTALYGICYSNFAGLPFNFGHDFLATGYDANNLYLTNALDGNTDAYGYPAYEQQGTVKSFTITGTNFVQNQTVWPILTWSNTLNGVLVPQILAFGTNDAACQNLITNLFKPSRDYVENAVPSGATYTPLVYPHPLAGGGGGAMGSKAIVTTLRSGHSEIRR